MMNCFGDKDTEILILQRSEKTLFERIKTLEKTVSVLREELAMWKGRTTNVCMKLTAAEQRNAALTEALMIYTGQHERSQSVGHIEMLNIANAALSGSITTLSKEGMELTAWALTINGEINSNWMTAGTSKSSAEGLRDNYISRSRPCNLPKLELVPLYRVKPTESGASE